MAQVKARTAEQKRAIFENKITRERLVCDNVYSKREFEGITWLSVHRENEERKFLIREDALERVL